MSLSSLLDRLAAQQPITRRKKRLRPPRFFIEWLEDRALLASDPAPLDLSNSAGADPGANDQKFVNLAYQDLLGRAPDAVGLAFWTGQLQSGTPQGQIAQALTHSAEYYSTIIKPAYDHYLGRTTDASGLAYWISKMQSGLTDEQLEASFIGSSEFYAHSGGTDAKWVEAMYVDLLGRPADAQGEAFWVGQLAAGASRTAVAYGFADSLERENQRVEADYQHYLHRTADSNGLDFWVNQFAQGLTNEDLIAGFVGSPEYYDRAANSKIALSAQLADDTGASSSDGVTSDAAIDGTLTDPATITRFEAVVGAQQTDLSTLLQADGSFRLGSAEIASLFGFAQLPSAAGDGRHTLVLEAGDAAGNTSSVEISITLDTVAPAIAVNSPAPGLTASSNITLEGRVNDATSGVAGFEAAVDRGGFAPVALDAQGNFSFATQLALDGSSDGAHTVHLQATDIAGNISALTDFPFTLQTAGLTVSISSPASGQYTNHNVTVVGQVKGADLTALTEAVDGGSPTSVAFDAAGNFSYATSFSLDGSADGPHTLHFTATDAAGNHASADFGLDLLTTPPTIAAFDLSPGSQSGAPGSHATDAARVALVGKTEPGVQVTLVGAGLTALASQSGAFEFPNVPLTAGDNAFTAQSTDAAGNTASFPLTVHYTPPSGNAADPVIAWNETALAAIREDATDPNKASRGLAMVQSAVYDAVNAAEQKPERFVTFSAPADASPAAAADQAAHNVLVYLYPAQQATFDAELAATLGDVADGQAKTDGVAAGRQAATAVIALRANDGWNTFVDYTPGSGPGLWVPTPPNYNQALEPQWATLTPWTMTSDGQFRPAGPPDLKSQAWADALNQVQNLGSATSNTRTADQTQIAHFWADTNGTATPPGHWNEIADQIAQSEGDSLDADARLFAELDVGLADAAIVAWDAKFTYNAWRPVTAIPQAASTGNSSVTADLNWQPLLLTPNFPEYVSGHSTFSGTAAGILDAVFGANTSFTAASDALPGVTRSFSGFDAAAEEAGMSRIYAGIHFIFSDMDGLAAGHSLASYVLSTFDTSKDTIGPKIAIDSPQQNSATNKQLTITGHVTDNLSGVQSLLAAVDGGDFAPVSFDSSGNFSFTTTLPLDGSADGAHVVHFKATDFANNAGPPADVNFTLDTKPPAIALSSPIAGSTIDASTQLAGSVASASRIVTLEYQLDGGAAMPFLLAADGSFVNSLDLSKLSAGDHTLTVTAASAAGNTSQDSITVHLAAAIPLTVASLLPAASASDVGVTYRPRIDFSRPIDASTLTSADFYAADSSGAVIPSTIVPSQDGTFAWLFFTNPLPGAATITITVDGSKIKDASGNLLDAAGNGTPGSLLTSTFTTVNVAGQPDTTVYTSLDQAQPSVIAGASLTGIVADPGPDLQPGTKDDVAAGPDGVLMSTDDVYKLPIAGVKVYILGREDQAVYTDSSGRFTLDNVPTGDVKLVVDGTTTANASGTPLIDVPGGFYFPEMVMDLTDVKPGVVNTVMGNMGTPQQQAARASVPGVYLPRLQTSILQPVSDTQVTHITADAAAAPDLTPEQRQRLSLDIQPGSAIGFDGKPVANARIGVSAVPPSLVLDMLPPGVMQHSFDITIQAPGVAAFSSPALLTFPNVFSAAPGTKQAVLSFDHTTGRLVIIGTATVSADGQTVVADPGSGILSVGWHGLAPLGSLVDGIGGGPPCAQVATIEQQVQAQIEAQVMIAEQKFFRDEFALVAGSLPDSKVAPVISIANDVTNVSADFAQGSDTWTKVGDISSTALDVLTPFLDEESDLGSVASLINVGYNALGIMDDADAFNSAMGKLENAAEIANQYVHTMFGSWDANGTGGGMGGGGAGGGGMGGAPPPSTSGAEQNLFQAMDAFNSIILQVQDLADTLSEVQQINHFIVGGPPGQTSNFDLTNPADAKPLDDWASQGDNAPTAVLPVVNSTAHDVSDTLSTAAPVDVALDQQATVQSTMGDGPNGALDVDMYKVSGLAGEQLTIDVSRATPGGQHYLYLRLFDASGAELASSATDGLKGNPRIARFTLPADGSYYVGVSGYPNTSYDPSIAGSGKAGNYAGGYSVIFELRSASTSLDVQLAEAMAQYNAAAGAFETGIVADHGQQPLAFVQQALESYDSFLSAILQRSSRKLYVAFQDNASGFTLRTTSDMAGRFQEFLSPNSNFTVYVYDPVSNMAAQGTVVVGNSGQSVHLGTLILGSAPAVDSNHDGIVDAGEIAMGISPTGPGTVDGGIGILTALQEGLDPLAIGAFPTGVVASLPIQGQAESIDVVGSTMPAGAQTAYVAAGSGGLAVVNVTQFNKPLLLSQLALPRGDATSVSVDVNLEIAAVADGAGGLDMVDVSNPAQPRLFQSIAADATQVVAVDGIAYAAAGPELRSYDMLTGDRIQTLSLGGGNLTGLSYDGEFLYTLDDANTLRIVDISRPQMAQRGSLTLPHGGGKLFVGGGVAYVGVPQFLLPPNYVGGYETVDLTDPDHPSLLGALGAYTLAGQAVAANGSGLVLTVGSASTRGPGLEVYDGSDPKNTTKFVTRYSLPASPKGLAIGGGLAFVADGSAGLQVVNYLPFDTKGVPPTVSLDASNLDADPATPGIQAVEGALISVHATISDDVQVRNVELLVNGQAAVNSVSFPFNLSTYLPTIASAGNSVSLQVRATDTGGNVTTTSPLTLNLLPDAVPPAIVSQNPPDGATIGQHFRALTIDFSKPLDASTISAADFEIDGPAGVVVAQNVQIRLRNSEVQITFPAGELPVGDYKLVIHAAMITDTAGIALGSSDLTSTFHVAQYTEVWINPNGGKWSDPANWDSGRVPGAGDVVLIDQPGNPLITYDASAGTTELNSLLSKDPLTITGGTLIADQSIEVDNTFTLAGGTIRDSLILPGAGAPAITITGGTLVGVTLDADLSMPDDTTLTVKDGLTLNGTLTLKHSAYYQNTVVNFSGTQTLDGTGTVQFLNSYLGYGNNTLQGVDGGTLTIGPGITIHGQTAVVGNASLPLINQGMIDGDATGQTISVTGSSVTNTGTLAAGGGGGVNVANLTGNANTLSLADNGSSLILNGANYVINQSMTAPSGTTATFKGTWTIAAGATLSAAGGTLGLGDPSSSSANAWANTGAVNASSAGTIKLGGKFTLADLGTFTASADSGIELVGTLDLAPGGAADTLALDSASGSWSLAGGTILGGTVTASGGAALGMTASSSLDGVTLDADLSMPDDTTLTVKDGLTLNGTLTLKHSAYYQNTVVNFSGTQTLDGTGAVHFLNSYLGYGNNTLQGVDGGTLTIGPGITIHGQTAVVGNASLPLINEGTIVGDATGQTILVTGSSVTNTRTLAASGGGALSVSNLTGNANTLSLADNGSSLTLNGANYVINQSLTAPAGTAATFKGTWTIAAGVTLNAAGGTLGLGDPSSSSSNAWTNVGTVKASAGGTIKLGGKFTLADLGSFTASADSSIELVGTLDLAPGGVAGALTLDPADGSWSLSGGAILGGTVTASGGAALGMTASSSLDGVTLNADLSLPDNTTLTVKDGLTLNGTLTLKHSAYYQNTVVNFSGTQTLDGTGAVQFVNSYLGYGNNTLQGVDGGTLTIGPGITIHGQVAVVGNASLPLINEGTIDGDAAGQTILVTGSSVTNTGTFAASGGGGLNVANLTGNANTLSLADNGSSLTLNGANYVINQSITAPSGTAATFKGTWTVAAGVTLNAAGGTLGLGDPSSSSSNSWTNAGAVNANSGGTIKLGGEFTLADLGAFTTSSDSKIDLVGTLDLAPGGVAGALALAPADGSWSLSGGAILGGTVTASGGAALGMTASSSLDGVTLDADLSMPDDTTLTVKDGLTLNGTLTLKHSAYYQNTVVNFSGTQTLDGTGTVHFLNSYVGYGNNTLQGVDGGTLTIGPGITIHGQVAVVGNASLPLINEGLIDGDAAGQTISVTGSSVTNTGTLAASGGGALVVNNLMSPMAGTLTAGAGGILTIKGDLAIDPSGVVNVALGGTAAAQFGRIAVTGAATLAGTLNLMLANGYQPASGDSLKIMTFASETGTFATLNGATISANLVWAPAYDASDLTLVAGSPQLAGAGQSPAVSRQPTSDQFALRGSVGQLQQTDAASVKQEAIDRWLAAGLDPRLTAILKSVDISIAHLGNDVLALTAGDRILLSDDAGGFGWLIDPDPTTDGSFNSAANDQALSALTGAAAAGHYDLLTVLDHEFGHLLGLPDQLSGSDLMAQTLAPGVRRTPSAADVDAAMLGKPASTCR